VNQIDFRLTGLPEYTDAAVIAEIKRVAGLVNQRPLTVAAFKLHGNVGISTLRRHFGSWRHALSVADLGHLASDARPITDKMIVQHGKGMSDGDLLSVLRTVAEQLHKESLTREDFNRHAPISADTLCRRFHGWVRALDLAGLSSTKVQRRYEDDECFENLLKVWTHYGRPPKMEEMPNPPSSISVRAYLNRWGTWRKALKAFVDQVNKDVSGATREVQQPQGQIEPLQQARASTQQKPDSEKHAIKLGLRYEVLRRDRFRCVICGRSPANVLGLELHVDHVVPFSDGGMTIPGNLRSTCSECNLGKGSKREER
jgi:hypothetical protein